MNACEQHEIRISAWLDDQLERSEQVEMLDHLIGCASCRRFYADGRSVEGWIASVRNPSNAEPLPAELWQRIETRQVSGDSAAHRPFVPQWALRVAASIVLAVGLGIVVLGLPTGEVQPPNDVEIHIGEDAGQMTDTRFVELTREVLSADPRYHTILYQVMEQVIEDTGGPGVSSEGLAVTTETGEASVPDTVSRIPA